MVPIRIWASLDINDPFVIANFGVILASVIDAKVELDFNVVIVDVRIVCEHALGTERWACY